MGTWISELSSNLIFWRGEVKVGEASMKLFVVLGCFFVCWAVSRAGLFCHGGYKTPATCQRLSGLLCCPDCPPDSLQIKPRTTRIGRLSSWRWDWPSQKKGMLWWFLLLAVGSLELQQSGRNIHSQRRDVKMMHSPFLPLDWGHFFFLSSIWPLYPAWAKLLKLGLLLKLYYQVVSLKSRNAVW